MTLDIEVVLSIINREVDTHLGRGLSKPEKTVIQGTWSKIGYKEMEKTSDFSRNYLMRDVAPRLWKLLSHIFARQVNKHNFRSVMENLLGKVTEEARQKVENSEEAGLIATLSSVDRKTYLSEPWKETNISFFGRSQELKILRQWILEEKARLVSILGIAGIGKTALAKKFIALEREQFDCIVWQEFTKPVSLERLVEIITARLSYSLKLKDVIGINDLDRILEIINKKRCLIVLDGLEIILRSQDIRRNYCAGYENYGNFFYRLATTSHQSCLLINSVENPKDNFLLEAENLFVRSLLLSGLSVEESYLLLENVEGKLHEWQPIIDRYQGHPLALKIIQETINNVFNGNVGQFNNQQIFIFGEIEDIVARILVRLSTTEREILNWLAIENQPVSMAHIQDNIPLAVDNAELMGSFISLERRGLLETPQIDGCSLFALGEMLQAYLSRKLIERVSGSSQKSTEKQNRHQQENIINLSSFTSDRPVNLSNWLQEDYATEWQGVERLLLNTPKIDARLRGAYYLESAASIKRCKLVKLGEESVVLLIETKPDKQENLAIRVQVYPSLEKSILPANLKLSLLNDQENILREVVSRSEDNFIQLPLFRGRSPEEFSIALTMDALSVKENFII